MFSERHRIVGTAWRAAALLAVVLLPGTAGAEVIVLRNDTPMALVVHASSVFRGTVRRTRPYLLAPKATTPGIQLPGNKVITIYDARAPTRALFQGTIPAGNKNLLFSIQPDVPPPAVKLRQIPAKTP